MKLAFTTRWLFGILFLALLMQGCKVDNLLETSGEEYDASLVSDSLVKKNHLHVLAPDDKINLSVWDHNELSLGSVYGIYNANEVYGRWVLIDENGDATLPRLGKVRLAGLTLTQAEKLLAAKFGKFLKYPIVEIQVLNREVTVLGEVIHPGNYVIQKEHTSISEVLGDAGGFDFYADQKHVKLVRHTADTSYSYVLDLTAMSPYDLQNLVVESGDLVYVPAKNAKTTDKRVSVIIPFTAIISSVILILSFVRQN